jgi:hypothetical protein
LVSEIYSGLVSGLNVRVFGKRLEFEPARVFGLGLRFVTVFALAVWFGGFTFYSTAVIDTSQKVLHSHLRAGLITQQVTNWLNLISVPALTICAWNWFAQRKDGRRFWVWILGMALAGMVVLEFTLFPVHRMLDGQIVVRQVADEGAFFRLHRVYLALATLQWCGTLVYIGATLVLWTERGNTPHQAVEATVEIRKREKDTAAVTA